MKGGADLNIEIINDNKTTTPSDMVNFEFAVEYREGAKAKTFDNVSDEFHAKVEDASNLGKAIDMVDLQGNPIVPQFKEYRGNKAIYALSFKAPEGIDMLSVSGVAFKNSLLDQYGKPISSNDVYAPVTLEVPASIYRNQTVSGEEIECWPGLTANVPFHAFQTTTDPGGHEISKESINARYAFGLKFGGPEVKAFISPNKVEVKEKQPVQNVNGLDVVLDRELVYKEKIYSQQELIDLAKKGVVGVKAVDSKNTERYFTLDGRHELRLENKRISMEGLNGKKFVEGFEVEGEYIVDKNNKKGEYTLKDMISTDDGPNKIEPENRFVGYYMPKSIPMPDKKSDPIMIGQTEYSPTEMRTMMGQGVIALVDKVKVKGKTGDMEDQATIFSISGQELGRLDQMNSEPIPRIDGLFLYKPKSDKIDFKMPVYFPDLDEVSRIKIFGYPELSFGTRERGSRTKR